MNRLRASGYATSGTLAQLRFPFNSDETLHLILEIANQTVAVGQASETDSAQQIVSGAFIAVGQASETDSAQTITPVSRIDVTAALIESLVSVVAGISITAAVIESLIIEDYPQTVAVGTAAENDLARQVNATVSIPIGQATETDAALAVAPATGPVTAGAGQATEADAAQAVTPSAGPVVVAAGQATEADAAQAVTVTIGGTTLAVGQATETDVAQIAAVVGGPIALAVGLASEADTGLAVAAVVGAVEIPVGQALETDAAGAVSITAGGVVQPAEEADAALPVVVATGPVSVTVGQAAETETGQAVTPAAGAATVAVGQAAEADAAMAITAAASLDITAALVESLVAPVDGAALGGVVVETLVADDFPSTTITGVVVETLIAQNASALDVAGVVVETLIGRIRAPVDVIVPESSYSAIARRRYGEDLVLPLPGQEIRETVSGDWPVVSGRANLDAAMRRRLITTPTQVVHRPEYGGALELAVGRQATPTERARIAAAARANALRDPRVDEAQVLVSEDGGRTVVQMNVRGAGELEVDAVTVVVEEG